MSEASEDYQPETANPYDDVSDSQSQPEQSTHEPQQIDEHRTDNVSNSDSNEGEDQSPPNFSFNPGQANNSHYEDVYIPQESAGIEEAGDVAPSTAGASKPSGGTLMDKIQKIRGKFFELMFPIIFTGLSILFALITLVTSAAIKHDHLPIYGYTDYLPRWGNIIQFAVHIPGLVVLPIMFYQKETDSPTWLYYLIYSFFPAMSFFEMIASITSKFSPSTFHLFMIIPYLMSYALIYFMKDLSTSVIKKEIISIFLLANILSIGSRVSSITQELFVGNPNPVPSIKYDSLFILTIAAGGIYTAFSGAISSLILFTLFWISLFFSISYPTFGGHIIPIVFIIFGIANIVIQYRFSDSESKWLTPHNYERRAPYMIASGFMTGYLLSMDVVCAMYTSPFSYLVFFATGAFVLMYHLTISKDACSEVWAYCVLFASTLLAGILAFAVTDSAEWAGYIGVAFLDVITQLSIFQFFVLFFGHITRCPHAVYLPMLFLVSLISYILRYGFISPGMYPELPIMLAFSLLATGAQVFIFKAGKVMRRNPISVVFFFFVVIGGLEVVALVIACCLVIAAVVMAAYLCKCGLGCAETIMPHSAGDVYTDCFGQMWEVVEA